VRVYPYRSKFEGHVANWLHCAGIEFEYETYKYDYDFPIPHALCTECFSGAVVHPRTYLCDFTFPRRSWVLEAKGRLDADQRAKFLALRDAGVEVRFVFQRNNWLYRGAKSRYSDWCDQHGFKYSIGKPDERWFQ